MGVAAAAMRLLWSRLCRRAGRPEAERPAPAGLGLALSLLSWREKLGTLGVLWKAEPPAAVAVGRGEHDEDVEATPPPPRRVPTVPFRYRGAPARGLRLLRAPSSTGLLWLLLLWRAELSVDATPPRAEPRAEPMPLPLIPELSLRPGTPREGAGAAAEAEEASRRALFVTGALLLPSQDSLCGSAWRLRAESLASGGMASFFSARGANGGAEEAEAEAEPGPATSAPVEAAEGGRSASFSFSFSVPLRVQLRLLSRVARSEGELERARSSISASRVTASTAFCSEEELAYASAGFRLSLKDILGCAAILFLLLLLLRILIVFCGNPEE